jgi:hypothetical protein
VGWCVVQCAGVAHRLHKFSMAGEAMWGGVLCSVPRQHTDCTIAKLAGKVILQRGPNSFCSDLKWGCCSLLR